MENHEKTKAESLAEALERKRDADYMLLGCACGIIECYQKYGVVSIASIDQYNVLKAQSIESLEKFNKICE
jgi:hypothetical protein